MAGIDIGTYIRQQLWSSKGRAATLAVGILVAAVSFSLLTAASTTSEVRTRGAVAETFRSAYDILVRPAGTATPLEAGAGLVRPNFESGIFGGISTSQWKDILEVPGVEVAAPVANLGYVMLVVQPTIALDRFVQGSGDQLFRVHTTWLPNDGLSRVPGVRPYVLVTSKPGGCKDLAIVGPPPATSLDLQGPGGSYLECFERSQLGEIDAGTEKVNLTIQAFFPLLVAAVDPVQENLLVGLDEAVVSGSPLTEANAASEILRDPGDATAVSPVIPVIAASTTYQNEPLELQVDRVPLPAGTTYTDLLDEPVQRITNNPPPVSRPNPAFERVERIAGTPAGSLTLPYTEMYDRLLDDLRLPADRWFPPTAGAAPAFSAYWTAGPVTYATDAAGRLVPQAVENDPTQVWFDPGLGVLSADNAQLANIPPDLADINYRLISEPRTATWLAGDRYVMGRFFVQGTFDQRRLPGFDARTEVPLEAYRPPLVEPADDSSRRVLGDQPLGPTANVAGYVAQPPAMLTTLKAMSGMTDSGYFPNANAGAPISAIRVRVADVTGPDDRSLERIRRAASVIASRTGLEVDITAGSSPQPQTVALPQGRFGQPPLVLSEGWVRKGVAVTILSAVSAKSVLLFGLILLVTAVFLGNAALATVRTRRQELGVLLTFGWSPRHIFSVVLAELAIVGLVSGLTGAGLSAALIWLLDLDLPLDRVLLVPVVAVALATVSGLAPAVLAARGQPLDVVLARPASRRRGGERHKTARPASVTFPRLAARNLLRHRGRTFTAAFTLALGVAALTAVVSITAAFNDAIVGSLLGAYVTTEVRSVDYLAVALALLLAGFSVSDVLHLNVLEREAELVTLRAVGWADRDVVGLTLLEALGVGSLGAVSGALVGVSLGAIIGAPLAPTVVGAFAAAMCGLLVTLIAAVVPTRAAIRGSVAVALAGE